MKAAGVMDCGVGVALVTLGSGALNRMQVFDARDGRLIGCLYIVVPDGPLEGLLARVSQRVPASNTSTTTSNGRQEAIGLTSRLNLTLWPVWS